MKVCIKCEKDKENFYTTKSNICKDCGKEIAKKYYHENKEKVNKYRELNKDKITENNINYQRENRDKNKETINEYKKNYREENKEKFLEKERLYRENNKDKIKISDKKYRDKNKTILNSKRKEKINNNPLLKSKERIRILIANSITKMGYTKKSRTHEILGCSFDFFKQYIEEKFIEGMCWDNHGEWHLDHKTPISWNETEDDLIKLNHYSNFQPLWAFDNLSKGNRWSD
jgi:hypothetical protein